MQPPQLTILVFLKWWGQMVAHHFVYNNSYCSYWSILIEVVFVPCFDKHEIKYTHKSQPHLQLDIESCIQKRVSWKCATYKSNLFESREYKFRDLLSHVIDWLQEEQQLWLAVFRIPRSDYLAFLPMVSIHFRDTLGYMYSRWRFHANILTVFWYFAPLGQWLQK